MTYAESEEKAPRLTIPTPFAFGDASHTSPAYTPVIAQPDANNSVNFVEGFPSAYSAPATNGGKYITRGQMNAIGRLATQNDFYYACGGLNTFDADLAAAIGGYPMYAVLQYRKGTDVFNVISLVDNNKVDFRGVTPTDAQIAQGVTMGDVDGENWAYCNVSTTSTSMYETLLTFPTCLAGERVPATYCGTITPIGMFKAQRTGVAVVNGTYSTLTDGSTTDGVVVFQEFDSLASAQVWYPGITSGSTVDRGHVAYVFGNDPGIVGINGTAYGASDVRPFAVTSGKWYSVFTVTGMNTPSTSTSTTSTTSTSYNMPFTNISMKLLLYLGR